RGPFWAVGARVGKDVLLFDPWRGLAFQGPDGKSVATLAQVRTNPDQVKFDDKASPHTFTKDDLKAASVFLAVPISSLSQRMPFLEPRRKGESGVRLAFAPVALRDRFLKDAQEPRVAFWHPPRDIFVYGRTLASCLPKDEGGWDETPSSFQQVWAASRI